MASWYSGTSRNRASPQYLVAAHRSLPFEHAHASHSHRNRAGHRGAYQRLGPFGRGRIIDLPRAAADQLGTRHNGVARVRLEPTGSAGAGDGFPFQQVQSDWWRSPGTARLVVRAVPGLPARSVERAGMSSCAVRTRKRTGVADAGTADCADAAAPAAYRPVAPIAGVSTGNTFDPDQCRCLGGATRSGAHSLVGGVRHGLCHSSRSGRRRYAGSMSNCPGHTCRNCRKAWSALRPPGDRRRRPAPSGRWRLREQPCVGRIASAGRREQRCARGRCGRVSSKAPRQMRAAPLRTGDFQC
jgi:hypothetical protein